MKKTKLIYIIATVMALPSCTPAEPIAFTELPVRENKVALPKGYSLFELGHALSQSTVDIFDPWLNSITVPSELPSHADPLSAFDSHPYLLVSDPSVEIFRLNNNELSLADITSQSVPNVAAPVPLIEDEETKSP